MDKVMENIEEIAEFRKILAYNRASGIKPGTLKEFCASEWFGQTKVGHNLASFTLGINRFRKLKPVFLSVIVDFIDDHEIVKKAEDV